MLFYLYACLAFLYIPLLNDPLCATHLQGIHVLTCHTIDLPWPLASEHFQTIEQLGQTSSYMPSVTPRQHIALHSSGRTLKKSHCPATAALARRRHRCEVRRGELLIYQMASGCSVKCSERLGKQLWGTRCSFTYSPRPSCTFCFSSSFSLVCVCVGRVSGICA